MVNKKYRVHRFEVKGEDICMNLEHFLNTLEGQVISILPNIKKASLPQLYGVTAKVDDLMIIERI